MLGESDDVVVLNRLIVALRDNLNAYCDSADHDEYGPYGQQLLDRADKLETAIATLKAEVRRLDGDPEDVPSMIEDSRQRILDVRAALVGRDHSAIVREMDRDDRLLAEKFEEALSERRLRDSTRTLIQTIHERLHAPLCSSGSNQIAGKA